MRGRRRLVVLAGILGALLAVLTQANTGHIALAPDVRADSLVVLKSERRMILFGAGRELRSYRVALGRGGDGPKQREGDLLVPEGLYRIDGRLEQSAFHRALHVSYPDSVDVARARAAGVPPGHSIMVHGIRNGLGLIGRFHRVVDWTAGCIAVTNPEIEDLWRAVPDGTPIRILH